MIIYNKYNIKETDSFNPDHFPKVQVEMDDMKKAAEGIPPMNKEQLIISYLKNHSLENGAITSNPELARLLTEGHFVTSNIESLFDSCRQNKIFCLGFEEFIRKNLAEPTE